MNEFSESEKQEFLESMGMSEPGLNKVITSGYNILNLHTYFTAGPNELRAWTIKKCHRTSSCRKNTHRF
ncbi:MAG: hypothetical protein CM15mP51_10680 [Porticoccaceae bacterium]|nr:MAG: hypothetical protein CM15mP51_10680 [Porticoccaceae bacterium]